MLSLALAACPGPMAAAVVFYDWMCSAVVVFSSTKIGSNIEGSH